MDANSKGELQVIDLGRMPYLTALARQHEMHERIARGTDGPALLLVEHDPVITVSQRREARRHLLADAATLARLGIDVQPTDRGGDITYHGPGQLVAYPILRLAAFGLNISRYMRLLEQAVIDTVAGFGIAAHREPGATGVWVDAMASGAPGSPARAPAKLAALGVRVRQGVTLHGLALNVTTNLEHFRTIIPCGLVGREVTSLQQLLGERTPAMSAVKAGLVTALCRLLEAGAAARGPEAGASPGTVPPTPPS